VRRAKEIEKLKEVKNKISSAITISGGDIQSVASGMTVDEGAVDEAEEKDASGDNMPLAKKMPGRKTKQQKTRAARLRTEVCYYHPRELTTPKSPCSSQKRALAEKAAKKRMLATVGTAKAIRSAISKTTAQREQARVQRQLAQREKLRQGLSGQRLGKHKVPDRDVDVQLGEDLSESLRALKVRSVI
jgi:nucleolar protein 53